MIFLVEMCRKNLCFYFAFCVRVFDETSRRSYVGVFPIKRVEVGIIFYFLRGARSGDLQHKEKNVSYAVRLSHPPLSTQY